MRTRLSVCRRKVRYKAREEAEAAAASAGLRTGLVLHPYRCERCFCWHITSRTKGRRLPRPDPRAAGSTQSQPVRVDQPSARKVPERFVEIGLAHGEAAV